MLRDGAIAIGIRGDYTNPCRPRHVGILTMRARRGKSLNTYTYAYLVCWLRMHLTGLPTLYYGIETGRRVPVMRFMYDTAYP